MGAAINNLQLSRKMMIAFTLIGVLLIMVAASGMVTNSRLTEIADRHVSRGVAGVTAIGDIVNEIREQRIIVYSRHNAIDAAEIVSLRERLAKNQAALVAGVAKYQRIAGAGFEPEVVALSTAVTQLNSVASTTFATRDASAAESLALIKSDGKLASRAAIAASELLLERTIARADAGKVDGNAYATTAMKVAATLSGLALLGLIGVWYVIGRTVARPMAELADTTAKLAAGVDAKIPSRDRQDELGRIARAVQSFSDAAAGRVEADLAAGAEQSAVTTALGSSLKAMSEGDLTQSVAAEFGPTYNSLKTDFNDALAKLRELIGSVSESANAITTGSSEIAQASEDLARRTESNAASLEETAASITQMDGRLKATATAASRTVERADQAIATVGGGRAVADEAVLAMGRVSDSAKGIDSVIEGLDKIAFQTRVLAMNAAVEAGRAGDAGRGFAVVADLVSALAMRAEEEAKRARDQLTLTQTDIVTAVAAVKKVDGALSDISGDVTQVHELLATIASDNQAQSSVITQISAAIGTMDQSTQQNAAMVEETSAAARNLVSEVNALSAQAGKFVVGSTPARRATPNRTAVTQPASYRSPVKPLPAAAIPALTRGGSDDWNDF